MLQKTSLADAADLGAAALGNRNGPRMDAAFSIWKAAAFILWPPQSQPGQIAERDRPPLVPRAGAWGGDSAEQAPPRPLLNPRPLRGASPSPCVWKSMKRRSAGKSLKR